MDWTEFHMCVTIVGLLKAGHSAAKIHTLLRLPKVNKRYIYHMKKLFKDIGEVCDRSRASQPCSARMKNVCSNHPKFLPEKNPIQEMNSTPRTVSQVLREDLSSQASKDTDTFSMFA